MAKKKQAIIKYMMCAECSAWKICQGTKLEHHTETRTQGEASWEADIVSCKSYEPNKQARQDQADEDAFIAEEMAQFKSKDPEEDS